MRKIAIGYALGLATAGASVAVAQVAASVDTNGTLFGYTVQANGETVCMDPSVWLDFRGQGSFIVCD